MHYLANNVVGDNELYSIMSNTIYNNIYLMINRIANEHDYADNVYTHRKPLTGEINKLKY